MPHPFLRESFYSTTIHYLSQRTERVKKQPNGERDFQLSEAIDIDSEVAARLAKDPENPQLQAEMYEEIARNNHYSLLNAYQGVVGMKWPVTQKIYDHFLEILPPIYTRKGVGGFLVCEAKSHDAKGRSIHSCYYREGDMYWHEYVVRG